MGTVHHSYCKNVPCWICPLSPPVRSSLRVKLHLSINLDVQILRLLWGSPWNVQHKRLTVFKLLQSGQISLTTDTEDPFTGRSESDPGGSVAWPVTPPPPASTGPTDMPPDRVIS